MESDFFIFILMTCEMQITQQKTFVSPTTAGVNYLTSNEIVFHEKRPNSEEEN